MKRLPFFSSVPVRCLVLAVALMATWGCGVPEAPPTVSELRERGLAGNPGAVEGLLALLGRESTTAIRSEAYLALLDCGDKAAAATLKAARDADPVRREHALALVGNLKPEGAFEAARDGLADENFPRKHAAAWALGELRDERAVPLLIAALARDELPITGREIVRALARFGPKTVEPLAHALPAIPDEPRSYAIRMLGELHDPRAQPALTQALSDPATRADAVWALGTLGRVGDPPDLTEYLSDGDWRVRVEASRAAGLLKTQRAVPVLDRMREQDTVVAVREWAARGLGLIEGHPMTYKRADGEWSVPDDLYR